MEWEGMIFCLYIDINFIFGKNNYILEVFVLD